MNQTLTLTTEWDKTFPKSDKVNHSKVTFHNRYGITLAADMYVPKNADGRLPALAVNAAAIDVPPTAILIPRTVNRRAMKSAGQ